MRWFLHAILALVALPWPMSGGMSASSLATVRPLPSPPVALPEALPPPALGVGGAVARDAASGTLLYQASATAVYPLASLTKIMTGLVAVDTHPDWSALVTMQAADLRPGGRVVLAAGEQVTVGDLLAVMLVSSSNEAAVALARSTGLTPPAFVRAMNRQAAALGLDRLRFVDPAGLEPGNVGTARDVARLLERAFATPELAAALAQPSYDFTVHNTGAVRRAESTNHLWAAAGATGWRVLGGKTGYLDEVGYNLAVAVQSNGQRVTFVVLGAPSAEKRWQSTLQLAQWVFASYRWPAREG